MKAVRLPTRSPNLNPNLERFMRSIREECLECIIFFGEKSLQNAVSSYLTHYHQKRNHQGLNNQLLQLGTEVGCTAGDVVRRPRSQPQSWIQKGEDKTLQKWLNNTRSLKYLFLTAAIFVLGKTVPAIHWTILPGFKRDFALFFAVGTDGLMHLSRTSAILSVLKSHFLFLHDIDIFADIDCSLCKYDNHMIAYFWSFRLKGNRFFLGLETRLLPRGQCS